MKRNSQQGVALVITLILLSVITFMAVTFLVVSRREGGQVTTVVQQSNAKNAADEGTQFAIAQIVAQMVATGNGLNFGMLVSTNYIQSNYTTSGSFVTSLTNVSYNVTGAGNLEQMLNNLLILPRAPVFVYPNRNQTNFDFRFYLDLNRNGRYDQSGVVSNFDITGAQVTSLPLTNVIGDPEYIGVLNRPEFRHSSSNFFTQRFAFIALPIGNSLDLNYNHNQAKQLGPTSDGFRRNQGVGSWEINLAGFLNALNTNYWGTPYTYSSDINLSSTGPAFVDAQSLIQYRYSNSYVTLSTVPQIYGTSSTIFGNDFIDEFGLGVVTNVSPYVTDPDVPYVNTRTWPGADNPSHYFTTQDLFDKVPYPQNSPANASVSFSNHLYFAGRSLGTYDRYTFYRLLSQMSFGSSAEAAPYPTTPRLNVNYNSLGTNNLAGNFFTLNSTNFQTWSPEDFFTNAADRMLRMTFPNPIGIIYTNGYFTNTGLPILATNFAQISITNIPIYPANFYTPAVQRILQLAANIYDATTNRYFPGDTNVYPSVFRPLFGVVNVSNVYIRGYVEDKEFPDPAPSLAYLSQPLSLPEDLLSVTSFTTNIFGVPWVIGAKKGLPNFNEISMDSFTQITRKVQIVKPSIGAPSSTWTTNIQYQIGISNVIGVEAWNSYARTYPRNLDIVGLDTLSMYLTNELGILMATNIVPANPLAPGLFFGTAGIMPIPTPTWKGYVSGSSNPKFNIQSFQIPLLTNVIFLTNQDYHVNVNPHFNSFSVFDQNTGYIQPVFGLNVTNRLRFAIIDDNTKRVLDFVQFNGMNFNRNLTGELMGPDNGGHAGIWDTNRVSYPAAFPYGIIRGVQNQIDVSKGNNVVGYLPFTAADWTYDQLQPTSQATAIAGFSNFVAGVDTTNLSMQVPYTPTRSVQVTYLWQANDPLVHYTLSDLTPLPAYVGIQTNYLLARTNVLALTNIGAVNLRYLPWGNTGNAKGVSADSTNAYQIAVKDPLVTLSDAWQFPTNAFPSLGMLGQVHRGTPWQTVYMKSGFTTVSNWMNWTGDSTYVVISNSPTSIFLTNDALFSMPTTDWPIFDLFTTSPNENASKGQLSINQTNYAAWAAVLDEVNTMTNQTIGGSTVISGTNFIDPTHLYFGTNITHYLYDAINIERTNYAQNTFTSLGQICSVPQLSMQSPYLNLTKAIAQQNISDAAYERIPQQIMSLLRLGSPRYVIFSYGQSLKPADKSIVTSGQFFGMCTNYQITGETATRTVIRIENFPTPGHPSSPHAVIESFNVLGPDQ